MALNLIKLAVGVATPDALSERQLVRACETGAHGGRPFFRTRSFPRRAEEVLAGGSIYWVTAGLLLCRQTIHDIVQDQRDDGTPCTGVVLDGPVVAVVPRTVRAFQGWRYLSEADAPADLAASAATGDELPLKLRRALLELCLL
jgi:hypothetical protein